MRAIDSECTSPNVRRHRNLSGPAAQPSPTSPGELSRAGTVTRTATNDSIYDLSERDLQERFRRAYRAHYGELFAYASRRLPDVSEAQDVVADTFLVLWRRFDEAPGEDELLPWLYGVARHVLSNRFRSRSRRDRLAARLAQQPVAPTRGVEEIAGIRDDTKLVMEALLQLSESDREVLLLAAWERLSIRDIAATLNCSENAAAIRLHRARLRLTDVYKKENERAEQKLSNDPLLRRSPEEQRK
jgi:RNA polymerase sigma factor (sigma-70 family)